MNDVFPVETVKIADLKPHPDNYRDHPDDQLEHIVHSIEIHGFYKNIIISSDNYILSGHAATMAAEIAGLTEIPANRLPVDHKHPAALHALTSDNEIPRRGMTNDRKLTDLLVKINESDEAGLLGTGFDTDMLANLLLSTRDSSEIPDTEAAKEYIGMPDYDEESKFVKLVVLFDTEEERAQFIEQNSITNTKKNGATISAWWPNRENDDPSSIRFSENDGVENVESVE